MAEIGRSRVQISPGPRILIVDSVRVRCWKKRGILRHKTQLKTAVSSLGEYLKKWGSDAAMNLRELYHITSPMMKMPFIFMVAYFVVLLLMTFTQIDCINGLNNTNFVKSICLITSAFNGEEIRTMPNVAEGLFVTFFLPMLLLFLYDFYRSISRNFRQFLASKWVFLNSIIATLLAGIVTWYYEGYPATGTSIITFSLMVIILIIMLPDAYRNKQKLFQKQFIWIPVLIAGLIGGLILDMNNYRHLVGGFFFLFFFSIFVIIKWLSEKEN